MSYALQGKREPTINSEEGSLWDTICQGLEFIHVTMPRQQKAFFATVGIFLR